MARPDSVYKKACDLLERASQVRSVDRPVCSGWVPAPWEHIIHLLKPCNYLPSHPKEGQRLSDKEEPLALQVLFELRLERAWTRQTTVAVYCQSKHSWAQDHSDGYTNLQSPPPVHTQTNSLGTHPPTHIFTHRHSCPLAAKGRSWSGEGHSSQPGQWTQWPLDSNCQRL